MKRAGWVAHTSRGLVAVFHCDELSSSAAVSVTVTPFEKFVAAKRVNQPAERRRYPEGKFAMRRRRKQRAGLDDLPA